MADSLGSGVMYDAWKGDEHAQLFGIWDGAPVSKLVKFCDQYNDFHLYRSIIGDSGCESLLDVGCATGRFFRYFRKTWPGIKYRGIDISESAIAHASTEYPDADFRVFDGNMETVSDMKSDVVFCRDVVHHQIDPYRFLTGLYDVTQRYLVIRVRTRDSGETVFDFSQSCQYTYENWVPYIVINRESLTDLIGSLTPTPKSIEIVRSPMILGGKNGRYLPKELYDDEAGGSETSIIIERGTGSEGSAPTISVSSNVENLGRERPFWARGLSRVARRLGA